jgi:transposase-like protein
MELNSLCDNCSFSWAVCVELKKEEFQKIDLTCPRCGREKHLEVKQKIDEIKDSRFPIAGKETTNEVEGYP